MSAWTDIRDSLFGNATLGSVASGVGGYMLADESIEQARGLPGQLGEMATGIAGQVGEAATFKPYTVSTGMGQTSFTDEGMTSSNLNQNLINNLYSQAGQTNLNPYVNTQGIQQSAFQDAQRMLGQDSGAFASRLGGLYAGLGEQQLQAQAPQDLAMLQAQMAGQASAAPTGASQGLMGLGASATALGAQGLGQGGTDVSGAFSGITSPGVRTGAGDVAGQALGQANLGATAQDVSSAYRGITTPEISRASGDVASQYLAAGGGMLGAETAGASDIYNQIRAMQTPEEERQKIALENRLAAQGRLGVSTAAYGGTPEQLAMAKAQEEAKNAASLQAIGMADQLATSQQNRAQQLTQMGLSADQIQQQMINEGFGQEMALEGAKLQTAQTQEALQSSVQARQAQLAQLGLSAEQIQAQLESEGFSREMQLGQANIATAQAQSDLDSASQARAMQLAQLGMSAEQIGSQLASEGLNRQVVSATTAGQLAQTGAGIQAQQQQLGQGMLGLGLQAQQLGGQLGSQDIANATSLFGLGGQAAGLQGQLSGQQIANMTGMLTAAGIPQAQQAQAVQQALTGMQMAQAPSQLEAQAIANLGQQQLAAVPSAINAEALLRQAQLGSITNALGLNQQASTTQANQDSMLGLDIGSLLGDGLDWLGGLFGSDSNTMRSGDGYIDENGNWVQEGGN